MLLLRRRPGQKRGVFSPNSQTSQRGSFLASPSHRRFQLVFYPPLPSLSPTPVPQTLGGWWVRVEKRCAGARSGTAFYGQGSASHAPPPCRPVSFVGRARSHLSRWHWAAAPVLEAEPRDREMALLEISRLLSSFAGIEPGFGVHPVPSAPSAPAWYLAL